MSTPSTLAMLTPFDVPVQKSIFDLLFVFPVLVRQNQLQVFDKAGDLFLCQADAFEKSVYGTQGHTLDNLGDSVWIDNIYWSDANQKENTFRTLYAMGSIVEIAPADILLVVQKGQVLTIFTNDGVFFKPAITAMSVLCPMHAFNHASNKAWHKGMDPHAIQQHVFEKGLSLKIKK